jgi:hypothetical protein
MAPTFALICTGLHRHGGTEDLMRVDAFCLAQRDDCITHVT